MIGLGVFFGLISTSVMAEYKCDAAPAGIYSVAGSTSYIDAKNSVTDPELAAEGAQIQKPFVDYMETVSHAADDYVVKGEKSAGRCAVN